MVAFPLSCWFSGVGGGSSCHFKHSAASVKTKTHDTKGICVSLMVARVQHKVTNPTLSVLNFAQQVPKVLLPHFLTRELFFLVHLYGFKYYPLQQEIFPQQKNFQKSCPTNIEHFFRQSSKPNPVGFDLHKKLKLCSKICWFTKSIWIMFFHRNQPPTSWWGGQGIVVSCGNSLHHFFRSRPRLRRRCSRKELKPYPWMNGWFWW